MSDLRKNIGGKDILKGIHLAFFPGAKIGVIGPNGAGKSTMMKIMAGVEKEFLGEARPDPDAKVGYLPQEPQLDPEKTVFQNVEMGLQELRSMLDRFNEISEKFAEPMSDEEMNKLLEEQGELQTKIDATDAWELDSKLEMAMEALRLPPPDSPVTNLSGGERRRVALCRILLEKPDLLLLDEPTNHLDTESVLWLERHLKDYEGTVVSITHDRYFLENVAEWILEIDRGEGLPFKGNYTAWLDAKQKRLEVEEKTESARRRQLQRELEWVQSSQKARQSKGKARVARYEELRQQESKDSVQHGEIYIPPGPELGGLVLEARGVRKGFGEHLLMEDLTLKVPRGSIVGVVGPNGAGKSTFFRMITGAEKPDAGEMIIGDTVKLAMIDQTRDALNGENTVFEEISDGTEVVELGKRTINARGYVANFAFKGQDQQKKVKVLSGGERNRVHLAKLLRSGGNFLLMDEPSNDLDVETLRSLEDGLLSFAGCAMVTSHDRWFLDRVATHILAFEGDSRTFFFEGGLSDYEDDKRKRLGDDALNPKRVKYKPLQR